MTQFRLRDATIDDADNIVILHASAWREVFAPSFAYPPSAHATDLWRDILGRPASRVFIVETEVECVAYMATMAMTGTREMTDLFVATKYRGKGIAKSMLSSLIETTNPSTTINLWVAETNEAAIGLYRQFGFQKTGKSKLEPRRIDSAKMLAMYRPNSSENSSC